MPSYVPLPRGGVPGQRRERRCAAKLGGVIRGEQLILHSVTRWGGGVEVGVEVGVTRCLSRASRCSHRTHMSATPPRTPRRVAFDVIDLSAPCSPPFLPGSNP